MKVIEGVQEINSWKSWVMTGKKQLKIKEALWGLSNISCDRESTASLVAEHSIWKTAIKFLVSADKGHADEATFVVCNTIDALDKNKVKAALTPTTDTLKPLLKNLRTKKPRTVMAVLELMDRLFSIDE